MKSQNSFSGKVYTVIHLILVFALAAYIVIVSGILTAGYNEAVRNFSDEWITETGESRCIDDVRIPGIGRKVELTKKLPGNITDEDCICIESKNSIYTILIDDREIFTFSPEENFTGLGYGVTFNEIRLNGADGGHTVHLKIASINPENNRGQILSVYLAPSLDYIHMQVRSCFIPAALSLFVVLLGVTMVLIYIRIPDKNDLPFSIISLSMIAMLIGSWLFVDTNIMQLITGNIFMWRSLNRFIILFALYPCVHFINSLTKLRRQIYQIIAFFVNIAIVILALILRFVFDVDTTMSFSPIIGVEVLLLAILSFVSLIDNNIYCKNNGLVQGIKGFYIGIMVLIVSVALDILLYHIGIFQWDSYGSFTRLGVACFMIVCLFQFLKWWTRDRADVQRDRFINKILQYAVSYSPEDSIRLILEFMGTELRTSRIGIFEKQENGKFHGTYEWFREDLESADMGLLYLPQEGLVDEMYKAFYANQKRLIISNPEEYKTALPSLYSLMISNDIESLVSGPLESNGKLVGWLAFIGTPDELQEETAEIISIISYFLTQLIVQREEQKRLRYYSYNDPLTGALNRRAFTEYLENGLDMSSAFGYLICNINGLEAANNKIGYEAGDRMVKDVVRCLTDVFGESHVYRMGGGEFAAFGFETDESFFNGDVERVRKLAKEKDLSLSIGSVFCAFGTMAIQRVLYRANEIMKADK
ncbi:MAG: diguanylate cyclase [Lachnospiraceae bacterium]|nr:diguanylate cyclase [Lachnospiraceae bacterium]